MMKKEQFLYLIWKDPQTRRNYIVGKLSYCDKYTFEYCNEVEQARESGWREMDAFPEQKMYESETLFPVFLSRLPDRKRRDINRILRKYQLDSFDEFELLRRSKARLPIDTYEFISPITSENGSICCEFNIVGMRYHADCKGMECTLMPRLAVEDSLVLECEPQNIYDPKAVRVLTAKGNFLGYIPRYYSDVIFDRLVNGATYTCKVVELNPNGNCNDCVKAKIYIHSSERV